MLIHRCELPPDEVTVHDAIPITTPPRTLLDLATVVRAASARASPASDRNAQAHRPAVAQRSDRPLPPPPGRPGAPPAAPHGRRADPKRPGGRVSCLPRCPPFPPASGQRNDRRQRQPFEPDCLWPTATPDRRARQLDLPRPTSQLRVRPRPRPRAAGGGMEDDADHLAPTPRRARRHRLSPPPAARPPRTTAPRAAPGPRRARPPAPRRRTSACRPGGVTRR